MQLTLIVTAHRPVPLPRCSHTRPPYAARLPLRATAQPSYRCKPAPDWISQGHRAQRMLPPDRAVSSTHPACGRYYAACREINFS